MFGDRLSESYLKNPSRVKYIFLFILEPLQGKRSRVNFDMSAEERDRSVENNSAQPKSVSTSVKTMPLFARLKFSERLVLNFLLMDIFKYLCIEYVLRLYNNERH